MSLLPLLALIAVVCSAPVYEESAGKTAEDMYRPMSKRMDEQIFYGNQQNGPRRKKSDPSIDEKGLVRALPAQDISDSSDQSETSEETKQSETQEFVPEKTETVESIANVPEVKTEGIEATDKQEEEASKSENTEDVLKEDQLLKAESSLDSADNGPVAEVGEGSGDEDESDAQPNDGMTYEYIQKLYDEAEDPAPYKYYYPEYYVNYRKKRDSALNMADETDVVKRNHRTKRGLGYDDFEDSYFPNAYDEDQYYSEALRKRAVEEAVDDALARELEPLLENYEETQGGYPDRYDNTGYLEYLPDGYDSYERSPYDDSWDREDSFGSLSREPQKSFRTIFRSQPTSFLPIKRQMLSMVPGSRRKRFNYPHSEEPESHWGAFVDTEKREEEAAYDRLYRLARALATRRSPYMTYWEEDEYKKK